MSKKTITNKKQTFQETHDVSKLSFTITIVNQGQGKAIISLLKHYNASAFFTKKGEGTATKKVYDLMGITENHKDIIFSILKKEEIPNVRKEMDLFFQASKVNAGVFISIDLSSIIGVVSYRFLSNT